MSDIFDKLRNRAGKVVKDADRVVDVKRIEMQITSIKNQMEKEYQKLGKIVYEKSLTIQENEETPAIIEKINDLKQQITEKENAIAEIKNPKEKLTPTSKGKRFCSECGAENEADNNFCSSCGAKIA